jgi:hypothetical protein
MLDLRHHFKPKLLFFGYSFGIHHCLFWMYLRLKDLRQRRLPSRTFIYDEAPIIFNIMLETNGYSCF